MIKFKQFFENKDDLRNKLIRIFDKYNIESYANGYYIPSALMSSLWHYYNQFDNRVPAYNDLPTDNDHFIYNDPSIYNDLNKKHYDYGSRSGAFITNAHNIINQLFNSINYNESKYPNRNQILHISKVLPEDVEFKQFLEEIAEVLR